MTVYSGRPGRAAAMASSDMNGSEALTAVSIADAVAGPTPCTWSGVCGTLVVSDIMQMLICSSWFRSNWSVAEVSMTPRSCRTQGSHLSHTHVVAIEAKKSTSAESRPMAAVEVCEAYALNVISVETVTPSKHAAMIKQVRVLSKDVQSIHPS